MFTLKRETPMGRSGTILTPHGDLRTPAFLPVATAGAMKGLTHEDLLSLGADILLCNTYHLILYPGSHAIEMAGGLHHFLSWEKPILTDSGGFQVFSLRKLRRLDRDAVTFTSPRDGSLLTLTPEDAMQMQHALGADIIMCLDECPPSTASRKEIEKAVERTLRWALLCKKEHERRKKKSQRSAHSFPLLFSVVQGGLDHTLRRKCAEELIAIGFDGYAVGGLAVGESEEEMLDVLRTVCPLLPEARPRYLMGVGVIEQLEKCVALGIDMFDCVLPMRIGRHGTVLLSDGSSLRITNAEFKDAHVAIDGDSPCPEGRKYLRSFLHHLVKTGERLGETIACKQNMAVTLEAMRKLRDKIISPT